MSRQEFVNEEEFEIEEPASGLESVIIALTTIFLLAAIVLCYLELKSQYGAVKWFEG